MVFSLAYQSSAETSPSNMKAEALDVLRRSLCETLAIVVHDGQGLRGVSFRATVATNCYISAELSSLPPK